MRATYYNGHALYAFYLDHVKYLEVMVVEKPHRHHLPGGKNQPRLPITKSATRYYAKPHLNGDLVTREDSKRLFDWHKGHNVWLETADAFLMRYQYTLDDFEAWCMWEGIDWRTTNLRHRELSGLAGTPEGSSTDVLG